MKKIFILILLILLVGCSKEDKKYTIEMQCDGVKTSTEIKENDILSCKLLNTDYKFKIDKITDKEIIIEANDYGLTDSNSLLSKDKKFKLTKDSELKLRTQTTDYQESVIFTWKD